jgi:hypothetical protein
MKKIRLFSLVALLTPLSLGTGCSGDSAPPPLPADAGQELPEGHPDVTGATAATAAPTLTGTVLEAMNSAGYTYARIDVQGDEVWTAGPATEIAVGDEVWVTGGMPMQNFSSSSLGRTFDVIYFVDAFHGADEAPSSEGLPRGEVLQAITSAGYTYYEVQTEDGVIWLAGPQTEITAGSTIAWQGGMPMANFHSSSLDRTFEEIFFVEGVITLPK